MASNGLPEDLVIEILSRLPVKSLLRFRCVCKSWCTLFEKPSFVSKHISNNTIETSKILVHHRRLYNKDEFLWLSNETLEVSEDLESVYYLKEVRKPVSLQILGSCYGVICLRNTNNDIILWNPSTRQSKFVPGSRIPLPPDSNIYELEFGFGYDVKTNDFKVVRFVTFWSPSHNLDEDQRIEVYSLSTDSWRMIDAVPPGNFISYDCRWTYTNGVLSKLGDASELKFETEWEEILISFDMRDEVFILTPMPDLCARMHSRITALNESIALFRCLTGVIFYEIWVLNEYGSKESWTKLHTIQNPNYARNNPLIFFWKNSVLVVETANGGLALLALITRELNVLDLISYKESLVPIKGGSHLL